MALSATALRMTASALSLLARLRGKLSEEPRILIEATVVASIIDGQLMVIAPIKVLNVGRGDITVDSVEVEWPVGTIDGLIAGEYSDDWTPTNPGAAPSLPFRLKGKSTETFELVNWNAWQHPRLHDPCLKVRVVVEAVGKKYRRRVPVSIFNEDTPSAAEANAPGTARR